eukprot:5152716-Heterocapsa_arctica.AAC.1
MKKHDESELSHMMNIMVYELEKGKDSESKKSMNVRHRALKDLTTATTGQPGPGDRGHRMILALTRR